MLISSPNALAQRERVQPGNLPSWGHAAEKDLNLGQSDFRGIRAESIQWAPSATRLLDPPIPGRGPACFNLSTCTPGQLPGHCLGCGYEAQSLLCPSAESPQPSDLTQLTQPNTCSPTATPPHEHSAFQALGSREPLILVLLASGREAGSEMDRGVTKG